MSATTIMSSIRVKAPQRCARKGRLLVGGVAQIVNLPLRGLATRKGI
jgi:hypothetical protein